MVLVNMIKNCVTIFCKLFKVKKSCGFMDQSVTTKLPSEITINALCNRVWPYKATM